MPIIRVENAGKLEDEQKQRIIEGVTRVVAEVTGKSAQYVYVRIDEVPRENFGVGGKSLGQNS